MTAELLQTKLYIPPTRPSLVPRPALIDRLNQGLPRKLTLISAPAGFGKTTLAANWLQNRPTTWLSLDSDDNDPGRFLTYLTAAVQRHDVRLGVTAVSLLHAQPPANFSQVITALINDLAVQSQPLFLVLDDYHLIENPAVHELMAFLLEHQPPSLHLVIASRAEPPFSIARWRVQGQVAEIRAADLRFTLAETAVFLNDLMQLNLADDDVAALEARTEGWAASLQLAALSLSQQNAAGRSRFIQQFTGSHRYLMDYLVDEILRQQPAERKRFLLRTAVLNRLCAPLCDELLKIEDLRLEAGQSSIFNLQSQQILEELERANLFLIPLDDGRTWFRYHHLFADFLQHHLRQTEPDVLPQLHGRASRWFAENGHLEEAIDHALQIPDYDLAASLIGDHIETMVVHGRISQARRWLEKLPASRRDGDPRLSLYYAWVLLFLGRLAEVEAALPRLAAFPDGPGWPMAAYVMVLHGFLAARNGRFQQGITLTEQALAQLERLPQPDATTLIMQGAAAVNLADCSTYADQLDKAVGLYQEAVRLNQETGNVLAALGAMSALTRLTTAQGRWRQAAAMYEHGLQMARSWEKEPAGTGGRLLAAAPLVAGLGLIYYQWDQLDKAAPLIEEAAALYTLAGATDEAEGRAALVQLRWAQGDIAAVQEILASLRQLARQTPDAYTRRRIDALLVEWQARSLPIDASRNRAEIQTWLQSCGLREDDPLHYLTEFNYAALARARCALGQAQTALPLIGRLQTFAAETGRTGDVWRYQLLEVTARLMVGETAVARHLLQEIMTHTEPESIIRLYVDEGPPIAKLLAQLPPTLYRDRLLAAFNLAITQTFDATQHKSTIRNPQSAILEPLSDRELEVLRLLAAGATNQQIADELVISYTTAKKHVSNIIGKLGVGNRVTAVARARDLHILP